MRVSILSFALNRDGPPFEGSSTLIPVVSSSCSLDFVTVEYDSIVLKPLFCTVSMRV